MIEITIKTLDSQNHEFSVEDDLTVKQLKEQIAESVSVPAESQRLIYCGRVLLDDKKLSEYDVNGKVIHLVQRAPPSSTSGSGSSNSTGRNADRASRGGGSRMDNAMYLGAMAFPADLMESQGLTVSPARLGVARGMLRRAENVLTTLEGGGASEPETTAGSEPITTPQPAASLSAEVTAAIGHAIAIHQDTGNMSITVNHVNGSGNDDLVLRVTQGGAPNTSEENQTGGEGASDGGNEAGSSGDQQAEGPTSSEAGSGTTNGRSRAQGRLGGRSRNQARRTSALADLITQLRQISRRMEPYLERYHSLMQNDPPDAGSDAQSVFNQVSECMHVLGHAYHALSDIMCDFSQPPPRVLRCRPVLIQHSALLQTGIPIQQAQIINFSTQPSNQTDNNGQAEEGSNVEGLQSRSEEETPAAEAEQTARGQSSTDNRPEERPAEDLPSEEMPSSANQPPVPTATVSISPSNFEIFMDVGSGSITFDSVEATVLHASAPPPPPPPTSAQPSDQPNQANGSDPNPWGSPPGQPADFIHSLFQRFYEMSNMHNNNNNNNNSGGGRASQQQQGGSSASGGQSSSAGAGGQTSSTDGESTSRPQSAGNSSNGSGGGMQRPFVVPRPHIHIGAGPHIQTVDFFDPFLPCNSHHIRGRRRGGGISNLAAASASAPASGEQQQTQNNGGETSSTNPTTSDSVPSGSSHQPAATVQMTLLPSGPNRSRSIVHHIIPILPGEIVRNLQAANAGSGSIMRSTLAQLLESIPGQPYTPGQSLIMDFFMTAGRSMMLQDIVYEVRPSMLGWMRVGLREFVESSLGVDSTCPEAAVQAAVDRINAELTPFFQTPFEGLTVKEGVDLPASIRNVSQTYLPQIIRDIHQAEEIAYMMNVSQHVLKFVRSMISVLAYATQSRANLHNVIIAFSQKLVGNSAEPVRSWLMREVSCRLRQVVQPSDLSRDTFRQFIVNVTPQSQPMEVDGVEVEQAYPRASSPREPLPNIILGTEPWHHDLPSDWVPIITRDRERQRRGANQGPLSDAYLAGMPSKRRKLITDTKPNPTTLNKVISESMGRALGAAGLGSSTASDLIEAAASDSSLRTAYKAQVRSTLESTLRTHPDYHPDKYPNTAKYFNRLHRQ